jgi:ABC-type antimicrobial peptide transport system permease subunit
MKKLLKFFKFIGHLFSYLFLVLIFMVLHLFRTLAKKFKFLNKTSKSLEKFIAKIDKTKKGEIPRIELIDLAMKNMQAKRTRTIIAVGGMMIGIGAIVFLVSIGYGLQSMVVKRVARLEEMRQFEVITQPGSNLFINDELINNLQELSHIELVLPQISVVAKVNYNNSATDMAVYGVTREYLEQSAIAPVVGDIFESNQVVLEKTDKQAKPIIQEAAIEEEATTVIASSSAQKIVVKESELDGNFVEVEGESDELQTLQVRSVLDKNINDLEAVVNRSFLKVLDIKENEAIGKTFSVTFIATGKLLGPDKNRLESMPVEYEIIGVTPDEKTPLFYVPFYHLRSLGLDNYSQLKVIVDKDQELPDVRQKVESQGYSTSSVSDTVSQINSLFGTARTALALVGTIALIVAALGMFNTLTVSLLERTREVGLLKAMGMKTEEIKDLFLAESMIMGSLGGVFGLLFGLIVGKLLEFILSIIAVIGGAGMISIVDIPFFFALIIVVLSFLVGVFTGLYPAHRATKISALNALRYE